MNSPDHPTNLIRTIAVIGAGTAGRDFALLCAGAGFRVVLEDVMPARLRHAEDVYNTLPPSDSTGSLAFALTVEDAVREADLAIDFVPDELESKLEIFCMIDRMAPPRTIMLTPTEALSITDLASCTYRGQLCFGLRGGLSPAQPVALIVPAVAEPSATARVELFLAALGFNASAQPDADAPMLVKNAVRQPG